MKSPLTRTFGSENTVRSEAELYETPKEAVIQLLEHTNFFHPIWEPAAGKGAISKVLENRGHLVYSTDLHNYGYGTSGVDFLDQNKFWKNSQIIITNPPYDVALQFCEHAVVLLNQYKFSEVYMLLRLDFLSSKGRKKFLTTSPLKEVLVFSNRIGFKTPNSEKPRKGVNYAWFVWKAGYNSSKPTISWI